MGVVLAILWVREPERHYDAWLGVSVAILAVLEFLKRTVEAPELKAEARDQIASGLRQALETYKEAEKRAAEQERALAEKQRNQPPAPTKQDQEIARFSKIISLRSEVESRLREYARLKGVDDTGKNPSEVLAELNMNEGWKNPLQEFLKHTADLVHEPEPFLDWAAQDGHVYVDVLEILLRGKPLQRKQ